MAKKRGGGLGRVVLGFMLGAMCVGGAGWAYLKLHTPGATKENTVPLSSRRKWVASLPSGSGSKGHEKRVPPFGTSEDVFEAGARIYMAYCASCHGVPLQEVRAGKPTATQFWKKHGVGGQKNPSDVYEAVAHGARSTAMPAYQSVLTETEMWQVSLLLANAGRELPEPVMRILGVAANANSFRE